jgi:hypothetical protein
MNSLKTLTLKNQNIKNITKALQLRVSLNDFKVPLTQKNLHKENQSRLVLETLLPNKTDAAVNKTDIAVENRLENNCSSSPNNLIEAILTELEESNPDSLPEIITDAEGSVIPLDLVFFNNLLNFYSKKKGLLF